MAAARRPTPGSGYRSNVAGGGLVRDGARKGAVLRRAKMSREKQEFLDKMDRLSEKIGPIGITGAELVREGRRE